MDALTTTSSTSTTAMTASLAGGVTSVFSPVKERAADSWKACHNFDTLLNQSPTSRKRITMAVKKMFADYATDIGIGRGTAVSVMQQKLRQLIRRDFDEFLHPGSTMCTSVQLVLLLMKRCPVNNLAPGVSMELLHAYVRNRSHWRKRTRSKWVCPSDRDAHQFQPFCPMVDATNFLLEILRPDSSKKRKRSSKLCADAAAAAATATQAAINLPALKAEPTAKRFCAGHHELNLVIADQAAPSLAAPSIGSPEMEIEIMYSPDPSSPGSPTTVSERSSPELLENMPSPSIVDDLSLQLAAAPAMATATDAASALSLAPLDALTRDTQHLPASLDKFDVLDQGISSEEDVYSALFASMIDFQQFG